MAKELKAVYAADPHEFYRRAYGGADVPKALANGYSGHVHKQSVPVFKLPATRLDDGFWQRISGILAGRPATRRAPTHGTKLRTSGFVTDPSLYRGANFLPPHAGEFMQVFAPDGTVAARRAALEDMHVYCSQLAHAGVNVVRVFYSYQSWRHVTLAGGQAIALDEILTVLGSHGIGAMVTLGNSFGRGALAPYTETGRVYEELPHLTGILKKVIVAERRPWKVDTGFYQKPGADFISAFGVGLAPSFESFLDGAWTQFVTHVAALANAHPSFVAVEYWNEPEGASGALIYDRIGKLIHRASEIMSAQASVVPLMEASSPLAMTLFAQDWLNPLIGGQDWLQQRVRGFGFHTTVVMNYRSLPYTNGGLVAEPGYPPTTSYQTEALRSSGGSVGAVEIIHAFLDSVGGGATGFMNELCIRGFIPQFFNDADLAVRDQAASGPWPETLGRMYWQGATAPFGVFAMMLADGTPWHPKERESMRNRNTVKTLGHQNGEIDLGLPGVGTTSVRLHNPTGANLSAYVEPLILEGGDTTLVAFADGFNDVPTHSQFNSYTLSSRPERHKIWIRAYKRAGMAVSDSGILDLSGIAGPLASLSGDLMFRDFDDNIAGLCSGILPVRWSLFGGPLAMAIWLDFPSITNYPIGDVKIDATWGGLGGCPSPTSFRATLFNPCSVLEYGGKPAGPPILPLIEREFMVREQLTGRMRQQYAGLSCELTGAWRRTEAGVDHFVLAFSRLVHKGLNAAEHYGPGQEAATSWSANYGDFFRNDPTNAQPQKREVILVDVQVAAGAAVTGAVTILPSLGKDTDVVATPGAEAIDPRVACNGNGDTVIIARVAQDPYFEFAGGVQHTSDYGGTQVNSLLNRTVTSGCGPDYLPIPYTAWPGGPFKRERFDLFHRDSHWRVYPWEPAVWVRRHGQGSFVVQQLPVAEPKYVVGDYHSEDWTRQQEDLHAIEKRDSILRLAASVDYPLKYNQGWQGNVAGNQPTMDISDPHTWHPGTRGNVSVSSRAGDSVTVLATWNQFPRALRANFVPGADRTALPNPAYELRSLRLSVDVNTGVVGFPPDYEEFGTTAIRTGDPVPDRIGLSVQGAAAAVLRPRFVSGNWVIAGTSRAYFQMGSMVYLCDEGAAAVPLETLPGVVPRHRPPQAAADATLVTLPSPHPASSLELAAWVRPDTSANSAVQSIRYAWSLPQAGREGIVEVRTASALWTTTDPRLEVVGLVPRVGTDGAGWPVGRIVWKSDDDVYWADVSYLDNSTTTIRRVSTLAGGKGTFPTHQTEVRVSANAIIWSHDGTVMAVRPQ